MASGGKQQIIVLGAGVIGLTTALKIQTEGKYDVVIVGEVLPTDPKSVKYTSWWAGAHHVYSQTDDQRQYKLEVDTFKVLWELSAPESDAAGCFLRIHEEEYFFDDAIPLEPFENMPDFKYLEKTQLPAGALSGISFTTVTIDTPVYLNYLLNQFSAKGGKVLRGSVVHINQLIEGGVYSFQGGASICGGGPASGFGYLKLEKSTEKRTPAAVINCTGLGSRFLGGVEDKKMYPVRGQTVIVKAPWMRSGKTLYKDRSGAFTYIIPRRNGEVIVGGTRGPNDWYSQPRPETTEDILRRGFELCPELAPPEVRNQRQPTVEDVRGLIVGEGCGLRPNREGGVRLEVEWTEGVGGRSRVPVVHNYGHGGTGFQASWASADIALGLLEKALAEVGH